jgi:predicted DNA-binding transcriptional regulator AlpA
MEEPNSASKETLDSFLNERETLVASGVRSRSTLRDMIIAGRFPSPVRVSRGRKAWSMLEVIAWQKDRLRERDARLGIARFTKP